MVKGFAKKTISCLLSGAMALMLIPGITVKAGVTDTTPNKKSYSRTEYYFHCNCYVTTYDKDGNCKKYTFSNEDADGNVAYSYAEITDMDTDASSTEGSPESWDDEVSGYLNKLNAWMKNNTNSNKVFTLEDFSTRSSTAFAGVDFTNDFGTGEYGEYAASSSATYRYEAASYFDLNYIYVETPEKLKGLGTKDAPYLINNYSDLWLLADMSKNSSLENVYFKQTADITLDLFCSIGPDSGAYDFSGNYDGDNHKIIINDKSFDNDFCSMFENTLNADIRNIIIDGSMTIDSKSYIIMASPLIYIAYTTHIENCHNKADINIAGNHYVYVSGLVHVIYGPSNAECIVGCSNSGKLTAAVNQESSDLGVYVAGIVYNIYNDVVVNCWNEGEIKANIGYTRSYYNTEVYIEEGGIAGYMCNGEIANCYNVGSVDAIFDDAIKDNVDLSVDDFVADVCGSTSLEPMSENNNINEKIVNSYSATKVHGTDVYKYYDADGEVKELNAEGIKALTDTLNKYVSDNKEIYNNPVSPEASEAPIELYKWIQKDSVNGGYPCFEKSIPEDVNVEPEEPEIIAPQKTTIDIILAKNDDKDIEGSEFGSLQAKITKTTKSSLTLSWKKVSGADGYMIYGNKCGKKNKYVFITDLKSASKTKYIAKKLKKGTYYKYIVVAYKNINGQITPISTSKTIHATTDGGKNGNAKAVKIIKLGTSKNKSKVTLKAGKNIQIKGKSIPLNKKKKIKNHRTLSYESSNIKVATVTKTGKVKAVKKGTCYIYVYAQNGVSKKIKITVK